MLKKVVYTILILLVFIAAWIVAGEFVLSPSKTDFEDQESSEINLSYQAEEEFIPGRARIVLGVRTEAEDVNIAFEENNRKMNRITIAMNEYENVEISTLNFQVNPRTEKDEEDERIIYNVTNQIEVRTEKLDDLGTIIEDAVAAGANQVHSIRYLLGDEEGAREKVIVKALNGISNKITTVSRELGHEDYKIKSMNINDNFITRNNFRYMAETPRGIQQDQQAVIPPISPQNIKIEVNIHATYILK